MILYKLEDKNKLVAREIGLANTFVKRLVGLLGRDELDWEEGLLLMNCPRIHCMFMKIPIDAVYLTKEMKVLGFETVRPWAIGGKWKQAAHVLELKADTASKRLQLGDRLVLRKEDERI